LTSGPVLQYDISTVLGSGWIPTAFSSGYPKTVSSHTLLFCVVSSAYIGVMRTGYQTSFLTIPLLLFRQSVVMRRVFGCSSPWRFGVLYTTAHYCYSMTIRCYNLLLLEPHNFHVFVVVEVSILIVAVVAAMDVT
jgi:hypothetical protein